MTDTHMVEATKDDTYAPRNGQFGRPLAYPTYHVIGEGADRTIVKLHADGTAEADVDALLRILPTLERPKGAETDQGWGWDIWLLVKFLTLTQPRAEKVPASTECYRPPIGIEPIR